MAKKATKKKTAKRNGAAKAPKSKPAQVNPEAMKDPAVQSLLSKTPNQG